MISKRLFTFKRMICFGVYKERNSHCMLSDVYKHVILPLKARRSWRQVSHVSALISSPNFLPVVWIERFILLIKPIPASPTISQVLRVLKWRVLVHYCAEYFGLHWSIHSQSRILWYVILTSSLQFCITHLELWNLTFNFWWMDLVFGEFHYLISEAGQTVTICFICLSFRQNTQ